MKPPEIIAGELCRDMHMSFAGRDWTAALPRHIRIMLGSNEWNRPLWRDRKMPPDGKRVRLERFEDYLMRPFRDGLGFSSWWTIHAALETQGKDGIAAIALIREQVPGYDLKVRRARLRTTGESWEKARPERGGRPPKGEESSPLRKGGSTDRLIARLKRDAPEIAARLVVGEFRSARAAARAAGFKVDTPAPVLADRAWRRMTPDERRDFYATHAIE